MRTWIILGATSLLGAGVAWLVVEDRANKLVWDHFDVVKPGILYRSGQLNRDQLTQAIQSLQLKTIVSFQLGGADLETERALCKSLGVNFLHLPMPGDGFGQEEQFREVLKVVDDPERRPVLVHCARGTCRTGAAVGLYRFERDGWTVEDVAAEMRRQTYRQGWLPGYVYAMVRDRPAADLFQPPVTFQRNRPDPALLPEPDFDTESPHAAH